MENIKERISKDATRYAENAVELYNFPQDVGIAFEKGAIAERNKTIDECIDIVDDNWQTTNADVIVNYILSELKKLKV